MRVSLLIDLLVTQVFAFGDSQFRAVAELPFDLVILALLWRSARPRLDLKCT